MTEGAAAPHRRGPEPKALAAFVAMALLSLGIVGWGIAGADDDRPPCCAPPSTTTTSDGPRVVEADGAPASPTPRWPPSPPR